MPLEEVIAEIREAAAKTQGALVIMLERKDPQLITHRGFPIPNEDDYWHLTIDHCPLGGRWSFRWQELEKVGGND